MDDIKGVDQLHSMKEEPDLLQEFITTISSAAQQEEVAFNEKNDGRSIVSDQLVAISPKAIVMISTASIEMNGDNQMVSICRTGPDSEPSNVTSRPTSHTDDEEQQPTHIDSVTLKCDLNDYLINLINVRCSLAELTSATRPSPNDIMPAGRSPTGGTSTYTYFDELVRCVEREHRLLLSGLSSKMPRLRLCGGGEDSINNGTSAWGTPPGATNGTLNAWGVLPNQQQQQQPQQPLQQPLAPSAWGTVSNNSSPGSNNNNNNNNTGSGISSNAANGNGNATRAGDSSKSQSTSGLSNAWNATVNHGRPGGGGNVAANVANNNGNHHHHGQNNNQQLQQQQAANMGNNNGPAGNGTATKQLEVLNTMRDALFAQDGWGCQHVNQDTNWEVPGSPEPQGGGGASSAGSGGAGKPDGAGNGGGAHGTAGPNGSWKAQNMNNGTELWETNLRSGGGPHLQQQQAQQHLAQAKTTTPWVPANNLGGTWMEDDDGSASAGGGGGGVAGIPEPSASVWNGSAAAIVAGAVPLVGTGAGPTGAGAWGALNNSNVVTAPQAATGVTTTVGGGGMWPPGTGSNASAITTAAAGIPTTANNSQLAVITGVKKDLNEWGTGVGPVGSSAVVQPGGPSIIPAGSGGGSWDGRHPGGNGGAGGTVVGAVNGQSAGGFNINADSVLRGDPRGISGRLNGAAAAAAAGGSMWGVGTVSDQRTGAGQQQWGNGNGGGSNKLPPTSNWDDGRPSSLDDATGGVLWGQGNVVGSLSRQNSTGWKDVADVMMRPGGGAGGGGPMQRNPVQGSGPFGPVPIPSGAAGSGGVRSLGKDVRVDWGRQQMQGIGRNGSWDDQPPGWGDEKTGGAPWNMDLASNAGMAGVGGAGGGWNKTPTTPKSAGLGWPDPGELGGGATDWGLEGGGPKPSVGVGPNKSPLEFVRASKEYRLLCEMGHKKEEVEFALRTTNMNIDDAMEVLRHGAAALAASGLTGGGWRRTLSEDHTGAAGLGMGFDGAYSGRIAPLNHATSGLSYSQNNQNMLHNIPGGGPVGGLGLDSTGPTNLVALNNLKYLSQGGGAPGVGSGHPSFNHNTLLPPGGRGPNQQAHQQQQQLAAAAAIAAAPPTSQQLRVLVQQIQLAVQNGFLNHQILNQALAPQTFVLLNQLLSHIKQMQLTQSNLARSGSTSGVSAVQLSLAINKHKAQITQLQQQIAAQQSIFMKQQQQQQGHQGSMGPPPPLMQSNPNAGLGLEFMRQQQQQQQQQDLMALQSNFGEMTLGKESIITSTGSVFPPSVVPLQQHAVVSAAPGNNVIVSGGSTSQQSRLNQWKLPSLDKDPTASKDDLTDFSRAPGPSTAKSALTTTTTNTNLSSLGLVQDGTWTTTGRTSLADGGWPEQTGDTDSKDWTTANNTSSQDSSAFTDLVPEFEPGKPWKGTQLKIEDDPSITPGSVARSPLSIATAKDSELFSGVTEKTSPIAAADAGGLNLTSSAWSFNTASLTSAASGGNKPLPGKSVWSDSSSSGSGATVTSSAAVDVWCTPIAKPSATRGPPPGLGGAAANKNGSVGPTQAQRGGNGGGGGWATGGGGTSWLLLKNLTSQIDASTLRTLCMQHGPILNFHSYPAHGLALCRYATREEAVKAQQALNNCTLGTSTIAAECPGSESEVQTYLQQLGGTTTTNVNAVSNSAASLTSPSWRQDRPPGSSAGDAWGAGWAIGGGSGSSGTGQTVANLWAPLDAGADNGTPTSLNSFLPDSLLGSELN